MNDINSQDDLHKPETHSTEVLLSAIDKCQRLELLLKSTLSYIQYQANQNYTNKEDMKLAFAKINAWCNDIQKDL